MSRPPLPWSALLALALVALPLLAGVALARGGDGGVEQHLLQRGLAALTKAEGAHFRGDKARARRHGLEAETFFRDMLRAQPRDHRAAMLAGQAAVFAGEAERARQWLAKYQSLTPLRENDPDLHYMRAFVDLLANDYPGRALKHLQRMYSLDPRARARGRDTLWWIGLSELGRRYLEGDKTLEAARQFATGARIARRLGDRRKEVLMLGDLGAAYMRADRFIEATEVFEGLTKAQPTVAFWYWRLGIALANQNRFPEAVTQYRKVIAMREAGAQIEANQQKELEDLPLRLGNCLRHMSAGEINEKKRLTLLDEAEEQIRAFLKANPRDIRGHKWLGVLLQEQREKPYAALKHYADAFAIDPMCEDVLRRMIQIHARYPAPEGTTADAWKAKRTAMEKDLEEGAKRRKAVLDERRARKGHDSCS